MSKYIPSKEAGVRVLVAVIVIFALVRMLPVPENIRQLFRV